jgi:hypothetical protein
MYGLSHCLQSHFWNHAIARGADGRFEAHGYGQSHFPKTTDETYLIALQTHLYHFGKF